MLLLTATATLAASCGGDSHSKCVPFTNFAFAGTSPNRQYRLAESTKPVPNTATAVLPSTEPCAGISDATTIVLWYSKYTLSVVCCCPLLLIVTRTLAGSCAGLLHTAAVGAIHTALVSASAPNLHLRLSLLTMLAPVTVTSVPPVSGPTDGYACDTESGAWSTNWMPWAVKSCPLLLTSNDTEPTGCFGGDTHSSTLELTKTAFTTAPAAAPKRHDRPVALRKFDPNSFTVVPPTLGPLLGENDKTVSAAWYVKPTLAVVKSTLLLLTCTSTFPVAWAGDMHTMAVSLMNVDTGTTVVPNLHRRLSDATNPVPRMVTAE